MKVNIALWRLGCVQLKVALAPPSISDSDSLSAFEDAARRANCALTAACGEPLLYRQSGYAFAVPMLGGMRLSCSQIPPESPRGHALRPATPDDAATVLTWYETLTSSLDLWAEKSHPDLRGVLIVTAHDESVGYLRLSRHVTEQAAALEIYELVTHDIEGLSAALAFARGEAVHRATNHVVLRLPFTHPALTLASYLGAESLPDDALRVKILDESHFLQVLAPELEERLVGSPFADFSNRLVIDLYTHRLALFFSDGRLQTVSSADPDEPWHIRMPPQIATQLWLGWRSHTELGSWDPDVRVHRGTQTVIGVLFPKLLGYIYGPSCQEGLST